MNGGLSVKVVWTETWRREKVVTLSETYVREWLDQPEGPISEADLIRYVQQEADEYDGSGWLSQVGNLDPQQADFDGLDVDEVSPVAAVSS